MMGYETNRNQQLFFLPISTSTRLETLAPGTIYALDGKIVCKWVSMEEFLLQIRFPFLFEERFFVIWVNNLENQRSFGTR